MTKQERHYAKIDNKLCSLPGWQMVDGVAKVSAYDNRSREELLEEVEALGEQVEDLESTVEKLESAVKGLKGQLR